MEEMGGKVVGQLLDKSIVTTKAFSSALCGFQQGTVRDKDALLNGIASQIGQRQ